MVEILIVDDDVMLAEMLATKLQRSGYRAEIANTLKDGVDLARSRAFDVIFLDVQMPDGDGLDFFPQFKTVASNPEIIIMTGSGDPDGAKKAIRSGAWSYLEKPHVLENLLLPLTRVLQYRQEKNKIGAVPVALKREAIIGKSPLLKYCLDQLAKAAASDASVLITGKTGTGKEVFARALHDNSARAKHPFVVVDCASLPETLIESALFGHVRGAFTGADRSAGGLIKMAHGGSLFLDEVGEMPERIQKTFLRVLQEGRYRPVGGDKEEYSDFRVIAATNRNLEHDAENAIFRSDLFFRLRSFNIHLPPLRERKEDIRELTLHFLACLCDRLKIAHKGITEDYFEHLHAYDWPGNIRELQQTLEQVFAAAVRHPTLYAFHLPEHFRVRKTLEGMAAEQEQEHSDDGSQVARALPAWKEFKSTMEKNYLEHLLDCTGFNIIEACRISGLSRARLYQLINIHNLPKSSPFNSD
ncbi:sigma-54-dependent transcriptional regulator [Desulfobulbus alkaliphilus]|uniref:sigma-54-dependent transcriptional regulator n=1 Tax=Desulfobulbus alkaliphilus TaxID=869814 RepID=UPI00196600DE|nr:sigma-54 dependent transcriptional regulator [Desulfobulbus alkaliphilus]MBM9536092.1 sigma-54-dependent Fis family transcriptional regulator [Desulfobulbus alkaliphilus]